MAQLVLKFDLFQPVLSHYLPPLPTSFALPPIFHVGNGDLTMLQLSVYRGSSGVQAIMNSNARNLAEQDESAIVASGIPYTIVRTGVLTNDRGDKPGFNFEKVFSWSNFSHKLGDKCNFWKLV